MERTGSQEKELLLTMARVDRCVDVYEKGFILRIHALMSSYQIIH